MNTQTVETINETQTERFFTQEEVNKIVQDRLHRDNKPNEDLKQQVEALQAELIAKDEAHIKEMKNLRIN